MSTIAGGDLSDEASQLGPLGPRRFADLVGLGVDPLTCPTDDRWDLKPALTLVAGRSAFDPGGLLPI